MLATYDHRYHAGNVGDVWKHVALIATLLRAQPRLFVDTHAGAGTYELGPTGEWTEGVGRLLNTSADAPDVVRRYLALAAPSSSRLYPGSPRIAASMIAGARLMLHEIDETVRARLAQAMAGDPRVEVEARDGLTSLADLPASVPAVVLIDPPYADRREWQLVPDALIAARPTACIVLWYPIKSYARPNAMHLHLEKAGLHATAMELITSPLASKKNRLNGSGVLMMNPPAGLLEELAALSAWLGPRLALPGQQTSTFWTTRAVGF